MEANILEGYFLMGSSFYPIVILLSYLALIFKGPKFMEKREPLKLDRMMIFYNYLQVIANGFYVVVVS